MHEKTGARAVQRLAQWDTARFTPSLSTQEGCTEEVCILPGVGQQEHCVSEEALQV